MRHCPVEVGVAGGEVVGGTVGGIGVDVDGIDVDVGGIDVGVGGIGVAVSVACGLHPNSSNRVNPIPQTFFTRFLRFISTSSVLQLLADGKRANY